MRNTLKHLALAATAVTAMATVTSSAFAGTALSTTLGTALGTSLPISGGLLGIAAAGVVAGVWITRRRKR